METFSTIIGAIIIILIIAAFITLVKFPKQILIDAPAGFLKFEVERLISLMTIITLPFWLPVLILDRLSKFGLFHHKFFKFFYKYPKTDKRELPEVEYDIEGKIPVEFDKFDSYFISTLKDSKRVLKSIESNLANVDKESPEIKVNFKSGHSIVKVTGISLYDFHLLIQCLDNDFKRSKNVGFAYSEGISFMGVSDHKTLNNIIGHTSYKSKYAFNLVNGQKDYLCLNQSIQIESKYDLAFLNDLIDSN
mgnify:CR=1 FL=1